MSDKIEKIWKDYTLEDWANAVFCPDCLFPLMEIEDEESEDGVGHYMCVCCTWEEDQAVIVHGLQAKICRLESKLQSLKRPWHRNVPLITHEVVWGVVKVDGKRDVRQVYFDGDCWRGNTYHAERLTVEKWQEIVSPDIEDEPDGSDIDLTDFDKKMAKLSVIMNVHAQKINDAIRDWAIHAAEFMSGVKGENNDL